MIRVFFGHVIVGLLVISCSAQTDAPTDQLLKGPFEIMTDWKAIEFDSPLKAIPHIQYLMLLSCDGLYEFVEVGKNTKKNLIMPARFKRVTDAQLIEPEVLFNAGGKDYSAAYTINGVLHEEFGSCIYMGYRISDINSAQFYLPKDAEILSVKIKANITAKVDYLYWYAPDFSHWPDRKWRDIHPSKIVSFK